VRILPYTLLATFLVLSCSTDDTGLLVGARLTVDPCRGDAARTFEPFSCEFDRMAWIHLVDEAGSIEMRRGSRTPTTSDLLVLQFADLEGVIADWEADPTLPLAIDNDRIRIALVLNQRCPDQVQSLVVRDGVLILDSLEPRQGGHIAGHATFDLVDDRLDPADPGTPAGPAMDLVFDMTVRHGYPQDAFTR